MIDLANEHGFPWPLAVGTGFLGRSTVALGQPREGLSLVTKAAAIARSIGARAGEANRLVGQAEAYAALGQPKDGLNLLREGARFIEETDERWLEV